MNAHETALAVDFLAWHADPARMAAYDELRRVLFEVASGAICPDEAHRRIQSWVYDASSQDQDVHISKQLQPA